MGNCSKFADGRPEQTINSSPKEPIVDQWQPTTHKICVPLTIIDRMGEWLRRCWAEKSRNSNKLAPHTLTLKHTHEGSRVEHRHCLVNWLPIHSHWTMDLKNFRIFLEKKEENEWKKMVSVDRADDAASRMNRTHFSLLVCFVSPVLDVASVRVSPILQSDTFLCKH